MERNMNLDNLIREKLDYNSDTGALTWNANSGNRVKAGDNAGTMTFGYILVRFGNKRIRAHRIAWFLHYGKWPKLLLDHINHNKSDNRISNLREVDYVGNQMNQRISSNNNTGRTGVISLGNQRYFAQIGYRGHKYYLGAGTFDECVASREAAERKFGFHENHGSLRS